jgi:hypothetical protein
LLLHPPHTFAGEFGAEQKGLGCESASSIERIGQCGAWWQDVVARTSHFAIDMHTLGLPVFGQHGRQGAGHLDDIACGQHGLAALGNVDLLYTDT